jgi:predicted nucleotidyltransferase
MADRELDERIRYFCERYLERIRQRYKPLGLWLWGSHAYGQPGPYSDIDLILVSAEFAEIKFAHRMLRVLQHLALMEDKKVGVVDVLCYTPQEFERKLQQIGIVSQAVRKGIRLI